VHWLIAGVVQVEIEILVAASVTASPAGYVPTTSTCVAAWATPAPNSASTLAHANLAHWRITDIRGPPARLEHGRRYALAVLPLAQPGILS